MSYESPDAPTDRGEEGTDAAREGADRTASEAAERSRVLLATGAVLLALLVAVVLLRLQRVSELPQGIQSDEGPDGVYALQVLEGEHAVFFPGAASGREWMGVYSIALTTSFLGRTLLAFRLPTALASAATVFVVFWLGRLLFGRDGAGRATPWRGIFIGGAGAGLLAVSLGQTIIGRASLRANYLPLFLALCFLFLWWGWTEGERGRSWPRLALAGVFAGLLPYTYIPSRFTPFLFLLFGLSFLVPLGSMSRASLRAQLPRAAVFIGVTGLVALPLLIYFALNPDHFFIRSREVWILREGERSLWAALLANAWEHILAFGFIGDRRERYNFAELPVLNPGEALFFWIGVGMAVLDWKRRPAYRLLLLWLLVLLVPAMLSLDFELGPNTLRMIGAAPAVYLLIAAAMWELYQKADERLRPRPGRKRRNGSGGGSPVASLFRRGVERRAAIGLAAVAAGLVLAQGLRTYRMYFGEWAVTPAFYLTYQGEWADAARILRARPEVPGEIYLLPYRFDEHYGFEYLYHGSSPAFVVRADRPDLPRKVESTLAQMEDVSVVRVVDWDSSLEWSGQGDSNLVTLLDRFGRYAGSEEFPNFRLHTYTDIVLDRPWTFYRELETRAVHYDGEISLVGVALGQGEEQFLPGDRRIVERERVVWVALRWLTSPGLESNFAISLRLHSADGEESSQVDHVLGNSTFARTREWRPEVPVDTLFHVDIPADLPPGDYELRLIVYNADSLTPTVEKGVWEPEIVLARLRLADSR